MHPSLAPMRWRWLPAVATAVLLGCTSELADDDDSGPSIPTDDDDSGPVDSLGGLGICAGGVLQGVVDAVDQAPSPDSEGWNRPSGDVLQAIEESFVTLRNGDGAEAALLASLAGVELCRGEGDEAGLALWRPANSGTGRAVFAWQPGAVLPLIAEAPHPRFESGTLDEAIALFGAHGARGLIVSGTHRCANEAPSGCDGTTSVCGASAPYRESDPAHEVGGIFQLAHRLLSEAFDADVVINLHGMSGSGASVSEGIHGTSDVGAALVGVAEALALAFPEELVTTCTGWEGSTLLVDERLCGTTNVQGRHLNGSAEPCVDAADAASGRFVHLEQSQSLRQQPVVVAEAIAAAISND